MQNIYFLQIMCNLDEEEHYENVYSTKERALEEGKKWLDKLLRKQYEEWFEDDEKTEIPKLTHEQLFKLKALYNFSITEYNPEYVDSLENNNLQEIEVWDRKESFLENMKPAKIKYIYDYNGKLDYISGIFIFKYKGKRKEYEVSMNYEDYINPNAGNKFKKGDIVKLKNGKKRTF